MELTARVSQGIPRLINVICDNALMVAFGEQSRAVEANHVTQSCVELDLLDGAADSLPNGELIADFQPRSSRNKVSAARPVKGRSEVTPWARF